MAKKKPEETTKAAPPEENTVAKRPAPKVWKCPDCGSVYRIPEEEVAKRNHLLLVHRKTRG